MSDRSGWRALLLAAGKGTRLRNTESQLPLLPKPLFPLAGKPVLEYNLELCRRYEIHEVAINLHWQPEIIRDFVGDGSRWEVRVTYSLEESLLGTAGGAKRMAALLGGTRFVVIYADNYTDCDLGALQAHHLAGPAEATVAVFDTRAGRYSGIAGSRVLVGRDDWVIGFEETRGGSGRLYSPWTSAGVIAVEASVFDLVPEDHQWDFGRDVFPRLVGPPSKLRAYRHPGFCYALDTPEAYRVAQQRVQQMVAE